MAGQPARSRGERTAFQVVPASCRPLSPSHCRTVIEGRAGHFDRLSDRLVVSKRLPRTPSFPRRRESRTRPVPQTLACHPVRQQLPRAGARAAFRQAQRPRVSGNGQAVVVQGRLRAGCSGTGGPSPSPFVLTPPLWFIFTQTPCAEETPDERYRRLRFHRWEHRRRRD
ncbi:MAG: hypothetical protein BWY06_00092 [Candidatus Latescibacteria bacterium ADurb.Bin168]|nr:MAG: hypothetical protein BWY06_00092 [Candidatus Latescibacteria bacterium ADurb.Bin168]